MKTLKRLFVYRMIVMGIKKIIVSINPLIEINRCYYRVFKRKPNLVQPSDLIEKTYWMEIYSDTSLWTKCADKYRMREYVQSCGLAANLPKLLAKWDTSKDVDFTNLPSEFILKTNNGCGTCLVVKDKNKVSISSIKKQLNRWLRIPNIGYTNAQLHYLDIKPCIIAEELLKASSDDELISPKSLIDYKIWCFNGVPECVLIVYDRDNSGHKLDIYDTNWKRQISYLNPAKVNLSSTEFPKPKCLDQMFDMARKLSKPFPEVRVDFYVIDGKPIIGELTFSAGYGNYSLEFFEKMGKLVDISSCPLKK